MGIFAEWDWSVTPLSFGNEVLHLRATTTIQLDKYGEKSVDVPVIDKRIRVNISPMYIVTTTAKQAPWWQFVLGGTTLSGAVLGIWKLFKRKEKKKPIGF